MHDRLLKLFVCLLIVSGLQSSLRADKLYEREPYDLVTLDEKNNNMAYLVEPLPRPLPKNPRPSDVLTVKLFHDPDKAEFRIEWHNIDKVETFEQLVLKEANKLVAARQLDEAYDYFKYLLDHHKDDLPELDKSMQVYLFEEAKDQYQKKSYDVALAMMRELHPRNPKYPGLDRAMGMATDKLVAHYLAKKDYRSVRRLIRNLNKAYPNHPEFVKWDNTLKQQATVLFNEARTAGQNGDYSKAGDFLREVKNVYPAYPGARAMARSLHTRYPRAIVGVQIRAVDPLPGRLNGWAEQRSGRLLYRTLMEYDGPGTAGGTYFCPVGSFSIAPIQRRLAWEIRPDIKWSSGDATLSGYHVARRLLDVANPASDVYSVQWAKLLGGVSVDQVYSVNADLKYNFVRPDALLRTTLVPYGTPAAKDHPPLPNGPYIVASRKERDVVYQANNDYFEQRHLKEVVERHFPNGATAIEALKRGEVQVLDRIGPWAVSELRRAPGIRVGKYGVPQVHCLVPNMRELVAEGPIPLERRFRRALTSDRSFRRALVYGIDRQAILEKLLKDEAVRDCKVISGPFPPGVDLEDGLGYADDPKIRPREYDWRMALLLANVALNKAIAAEKKRREITGEPGAVEEEIKEIPRFVLAYSGGEIAETTCKAIKEYLQKLEIPIELKRLPGPAPQQIPEDVDFLYAELAMWEPVVDARRLLGERGLAGGCSSYMSLALRQLDEAANWPAVRGTLQDIHRIAYRDVTVIPLWQMVNFYACREGGKRGLEEKGFFETMGRNPITLYQHVEEWRPPFLYPEVEEEQ